MDSDQVSIYVLNGLATAPSFMDSFRLALHRLVEEQGLSVRSELLFPYGDWSRRVFPQLREISHDMRLGATRYERSIGGKRAVEAINAKPLGRAGKQKTIWIGHSGGGIAAVHAAGIHMEQEGRTTDPIILIGAPRCRIQQDLRSSVLYVYAAKSVTSRSTTTAASRKIADRICRLGTFGGWTANERGLPSWSMDKYAPLSTCGVSIIGGHPDYFRENPPFVNSHGLSNHSLTLHAVWSWLEQRI